MSQENSPKHSKKEKVTSLGQKKSSKKLDQDFINLIDDLFLKLEMSYHYQFYKVFGDDERLKEGKKLWALSLKKFENHHIKGGISKVVAKNDFLPTLSDFIKCCEETKPNKNDIPLEGGSGVQPTVEVPDSGGTHIIALFE